MNIEKLQKAIAIMNFDGKSGNVYGYDDTVEFYPMTDSFTKEQCEGLAGLGFMPSECGDGWVCFT